MYCVRLFWYMNTIHFTDVLDAVRDMLNPEETLLFDFMDKGKMWMLLPERIPSELLIISLRVFNIHT